MSHAIRFHATGAPDVLQWEVFEPAAPAAGEARVRHHAVGLNYIDTYIRSGLYPQPSLPFTLGQEGAGEVTMAEFERISAPDMIERIRQFFHRDGNALPDP